MTNQADEETPLLAPPKKRTPIPWSQLTIVLFLQLAEPFTSHVINPFTPQLIRDIGIADGDESRVGYYVGLLQSIFFLAQACTVLHWSRASDFVGRKPIILVGLFGLSLSMFCFGLSKTFWTLVISRCLNGALNGNIGVLKSVMVEITDLSNIAQVYAYMPIAWSTGGTIGPLIGGSLSRPAEQFPELFGNNKFLKKYPYFLPSAVPAVYSALAWLIAFVFLKETLKSPLSVSGFFSLLKTKITSSTQPIAEFQERVTCRQPPVLDEDKLLSLRALLTQRVIIAAGNYAVLSLVDMAFRAVYPLFLSTPVALGGLGLPPSTIGSILSIYGVFNGIVQILFFASIHDRFGSRKTYLGGILAFLPCFILFPIISEMAKSQGLCTAVWVTVAVQIFLSIGLNISYGAVFIFIQAASPNRASLGATNGLSQMTVSVMRAVGPALANSLFSLSMEKGYLNGYLVYYILAVVACTSVYIGSLLPRKL